MIEFVATKRFGSSVIVATFAVTIKRCSYMAKTNPIGVRFDGNLLNTLKEASIATTPQKALNLYEKTYMESIEKRMVVNNLPENKKRIQEERNTPHNAGGQKPELPDEEKKVIQARIEELRKELSKPPKEVAVGIKVWTRVRQQELYELENKLK